MIQQEELELPYTIKKYARMPTKEAPAQLLQVHSLGKAPVLTDGSLTLAESGAIVEYLITKYGKEQFGITDECSEAWIDNVFFTHYSEGSVQPVILQRLFTDLVPNVLPFFIRPIARIIFNKMDDLIVKRDLERHGKLIEAQLAKVESKGGWLAGDGEDRPTSADFMMSITLQLMLQSAPECAGPRIKEYVKKFQNRPAYQTALEKGGEFGLLYKE